MYYLSVAFIVSICKAVIVGCRVYILVFYHHLHCSWFKAWARLRFVNKYNKVSKSSYSSHFRRLPSFKLPAPTQSRTSGACSRSRNFRCLFLVSDFRCLFPVSELLVPGLGLPVLVPGLGTSCSRSRPLTTFRISLICEAWYAAACFHTNLHTFGVTLHGTVLNILT